MKQACPCETWRPYWKQQPTVPIFFIKLQRVHPSAHTKTTSYLLRKMSNSDEIATKPPGKDRHCHYNAENTSVQNYNQKTKLEKSSNLCKSHFQHLKESLPSKTATPNNLDLTAHAYRLLFCLKPLRIYGSRSSKGTQLLGRA